MISAAPDTADAQPSAGGRTGSPVFLAGDGQLRLRRLVAKRRAEDERLVCIERAQILLETRKICARLTRVPRQAAVLQALCEGISPVIEPEDILAGRMPEILPDEAQERFVSEHPELFDQPGVPDWLDSVSIFVPDWPWLIEKGLGGIAEEARLRHQATGLAPRQAEFLAAVGQAMEALALLLRRYAAAARDAASTEPRADRRSELEATAARCDRVAWDPPQTFVDALQLLQIVHMVLSCLVGGRDITPGRLDQYLGPLYTRDVERNAICAEDAVVLLAMFFLRLSQTAGNGTDFDDNVRRSPCRYSHLYVTVGGADARGASCVNALSFAIADAVRLLDYKEPTLLVRYHDGLPSAFADTVAALIADRCPVTVYNDPVVIRALSAQGVPLDCARDYAHSACHNAIVPGHEAGSGPGGFHNIPRLLLLAMDAGRDLQTHKRVGAPTPEPEDIASFGNLMEALRLQMRHLLAGARKSTESRWEHHHEGACPLLPSALMRVCLERSAPAWQAAPVSHLNHYFAGVATVVDSLLAVRRLVFDERSLALAEFLEVLRNDWKGQEPLRERIRRRLPRYGQDDSEAGDMAEAVGRMWVEEVEAASKGMARLEMWPGFYSHMYHARHGAATPATPDGRVRGDALSENLAPSAGTPGCTPTTILRTMARLPLDRTPSGAAILTLPDAAFLGRDGASRLRSLIESYFAMGGLHLHVNAIPLDTLLDALERPDRYGDLMVRVAGFSAYFVQLSDDVQQDVIRRHTATP